MEKPPFTGTRTDINWYETRPACLARSNSRIMSFDEADFTGQSLATLSAAFAIAFGLGTG